MPGILFNQIISSSATRKTFKKADSNFLKSYGETHIELLDPLGCMHLDQAFKFCEIFANVVFSGLQLCFCC